MKVRAFALSLVLVLLALGSPKPVVAQQQVGQANTSTTTTETQKKNPYWMHSAQDVVDIATKNQKSAESLNKEFGDIGAGTNQQIGFILSNIGGCDSACNPNCPQALDYRKSTLAGLSNIALATYANPPASTYAYVADVGKTLGFMPKVQAQDRGIGFSGLSVLLPLWKAFRNIAYALLAVIMIIVGFMVMFRKKIDPKTVVTVQNAIPRIVIALLLITFSYAIVGLMVDAMYFVIVLAVSIISSAHPDTIGSGNSFLMTGNVCLNVPPTGLTPSGVIQIGQTPKTEEVTGLLLGGGIGRLMGFFFGSGMQAFDDIGNVITGNNPVVEQVATFAGPLLGFLFSGNAKGALAGTLLSGPVLLGVILVVVLLFGFLRLVLMLVNAYINIIISLITAPFQLMAEAIPGTNAFASWFRFLTWNLLTFPVTIILMLIAAILTSSESAQKLWAPPLLASSGGTYGMAGFVGLGMLLVIPNVVGAIQKAMKAEPFIPGGVGAVLGPLGQGVGQLTQLVYQGSFIAGAIRHKPDNRSPLQVVREGAQKGFGSITSGGEGGH